MIRVLDVSFNANPHLNNAEVALHLQKEGYGYLEYLKDKVSLAVVAHLNFKGTHIKDEVEFHFFKRKDRVWDLSLNAIFWMKHFHPDILVSQGMIFPIQLIATRIILGKNVKILVQHHGELPPNGIRRWLCSLADRFVDGYFFTSRENAVPWKEKRIISLSKRCFEVLEASSYLNEQDKIMCKQALGISEKHTFLWVGRLNPNKDPITAIKGFSAFLETKPDAALYMIFQTQELLPEIHSMIENSPLLRNAVRLIGAVPHEQMNTWYSATDYYISASHKEGSGYALLEAMACGCIPIVSSIPTFRKITANGRYGLLFDPGNTAYLCRAIEKAIQLDKLAFSISIKKHFQEHLSFRSIAFAMDQAFETLLSNNDLKETAAASIRNGSEETSSTG